MVMLLALGAAASYGAADFLGGAASRRASVLKVLMITVPVALAAMTMAALAVGTTGGGTGGTALLWGLAAGLAGGTGLISFYRALARGSMSVVAPVSALAAAILPIAMGLAQGERLDALVIGGVLLCLVAVALVSMEENPDRKGGQAAEGGTGGGRSPGTFLWRIATSAPLMAALSGVGFGVFFVLLKQAGPDDGLWPLVVSRLGGFGVVLVAYFAGGRHGDRIPGRGTFGWAILSGVLDAAANTLYFVAVRDGQLSLVAVLTSLYPAVTVMLARMVYSERLRPVQQMGMLVAVAGVSLVTVG